MKMQNAQIKRAHLGKDDHSVLAVCLDLEYGNGNTQSFGTYDLADAGCLAFITAVLRVVGVRSWEELVGRHVRIRADNGLIVSLGHYMKEDWFCPRDDLPTVKSQGEASPDIDEVGNMVNYLVDEGWWGLGGGRNKGKIQAKVTFLGGEVVGVQATREELIMKLAASGELVEAVKREVQACKARASK